MPLNKDSFKNLFITEDVLKREGCIDRNVNTEVIYPAIIEAQDLHLQPLLSTSLFVYLQNKIQNESLNEKEELLLSAYIQPCLVRYIKAEYFYLSTFQNKGAGVVQITNEHIQPLDLDQIQRLSAREIQKAEFYGERLVKYLKDNKADFPAYKECEPESSPDLPGSKTAYRFPIIGCGR